jgi:hypothetical protein
MSGAWLSESSKVDALVDTRGTTRQHPAAIDRAYVAPIAFKQVDPCSANYKNDTPIGYLQSSVIYRKCYNLGGGQFAATARYYMINGTGNTTVPTAAEVYALPFQVNQTTGAITVGTGAAGLSLVYNGTTIPINTNIDTGTMNQLGNYIMHQSTSPAAGSNSFTAFRINPATNSVAATATTITGGPQAQPQNNFEAPGSYNAATGTAYHYTQTYDTATGLFRRVSYSFNGTSVALVQNEATPTGYQAYSNIWPVKHQFGAANNSPTTGAGVRVWRDSNGCPNFDLLNLAGGYDATGNFQTAGYDAGAITWDGFGLELSNGRQIFYTINGQAFVRIGNAISNVTELADWPVKWRSWSFNDIWPVGVDTYITQTTSMYELVKFSINPTTYKITILDVVDTNKYLPNTNFTWNLNNLHISTTGSSNQFLVYAGSNYDNTVRQNVWVLPNPFA